MRKILIVMVLALCAMSCNNQHHSQHTQVNYITTPTVMSIVI